MPCRPLTPRPVQSTSKNIHAPGLLGQLSAESRVGDGYQFARALLGRLAAQLGHAVLGDDVVDVALAGAGAGAGADMGAGAEHGHHA